MEKRESSVGLHRDVADNSLPVVFVVSPGIKVGVNLIGSNFHPESMGDASIHILMDATLRGTVECEGVSSFISPNFRFDSFSRTLPADTPLSELVDVIFSEISTVTKAAEETKSASILNRLIIIDASYHPPKDITSIVRQKGIHASGPESVTFHALGWFPSCKLAILSAPPSDDELQMRCQMLTRFIEWQARNASLHEEFEYNVGSIGTSSSSSSTITNVVQWTGINDGSTTMMPSKIFDAVARRDIVSSVASSTTPIPIRMTKKQRMRTDKERTARLDAILQNLNKQSTTGGKKKKAVSEKVRTMLLKSRSEGNTKLRMEDRFHLELVKVYDVSDGTDQYNGDCDTSSYRFYSRQTTAGKVTSSLVGTLGNDRASEFLVRFPKPLVSTSRGIDNDTTTQPQQYRRLPNTMTLHDAERAGWIREFDVVLVRIFSLLTIVDGTSTNDGPSNSVLDPDSDDEELPEGDDDEPIGGNNATIFCDEGRDEIAVADDIEADVICSKFSGDSNSQLQQRLLQQRIHAIYLSLDETKDARTKNKPVSKQVHNMLMKSKASGNSRIKQEDRIYIKVILFHDSESTTDARPSSSYRFFSKQNNIRQIITTVLDGEFSMTNSDNDKTDGGCIELIARCQKDPSYQALPTSLTLGDAIEMGYIENFGAVLIRSLGNDNYVPCIQADNNE